VRPIIWTGLSIAQQFFYRIHNQPRLFLEQFPLRPVPFAD